MLNNGPPSLAMHEEDFHVHMTRLWHHERAPVKLGAATRSPSTTTTAPTSPSTWQLGRACLPAGAARARRGVAGIVLR